MISTAWNWFLQEFLWSNMVNPHSGTTPNSQTSHVNSWEKSGKVKLPRKEILSWFLLKTLPDLRESWLRFQERICFPHKQVWETVYNELRAEDRLRDNEKIPRKRKHDPHDHIEVIDPVNVPDPKLQWIISGSDSRISNQGTYSLSSLPPLLSKLKKNPPKIWFITVYQ